MLNNFTRVCDIAMNVGFSKFNWKLFFKRGNLKNVFNEIKEGFPLKNVVSFNVGFQFLVIPFTWFRNPGQVLNIVASIITLSVLGYWSFVMYGIQYSTLFVLSSLLIGSRWIFSKDGYMITTAMMFFSFLFIVFNYYSASFLSVPIMVGVGAIGLVLIFKNFAGKLLYYTLMNGTKIAIFTGSIVTGIILLLIFGFKFIPLCFVMGLLATATILTYNGSIHHVITLLFVMGMIQLKAGDYALAVHETFSILIGMALPVLLIEGYYRILKLRGYPFKTFFQAATYFNQWDTEQLEHPVTHHNIQALDFIILLQEMEGIIPLLFVCTGLWVIFTATTITWTSVLMVSMLFAGIISWFFDYSGRSTKYFYNNIYFCIPFLMMQGLTQMPFLYALGFLGITAIMFVVEKSYIFKKTSFTKGIEWLLEQKAEKVIGCNYYGLVEIFGRDNVRYAANNSRELRKLIKKGFRYMHVDSNADALMFPEQRKLLKRVEKYNTPAFSIPDDLFESIPLKWMYLGESAKTEQFSLGLKALADETRRNTVIYDLKNVRLR